jgi:hypothetical protein
MRTFRLEAEICTDTANQNFNRQVLRDDIINAICYIGPVNNVNNVVLIETTPPVEPLPVTVKVVD